MERTGSLTRFPRHRARDDLIPRNIVSLPWLHHLFDYSGNFERLQKLHNDLCSLMGF